MTLSNFLSKVNWRLMVIHFVACWFFIYAFKELAVLHDIAFAHAAASVKIFDVDKEINAIMGFGSDRVHSNLLWLQLSGPVGFLIGIITSLLVSLKHKWYWLNSLIVL